MTPRDEIRRRVADMSEEVNALFNRMRSAETGRVDDDELALVMGLLLDFHPDTDPRIVASEVRELIRRLDLEKGSDPLHTRTTIDVDSAAPLSESPETSSPEQSSTWIDLFPWLEQMRPLADDESRPSWHHSPVNDVPMGERQVILGRCVEFILDRLGNWPLGELFPSLPDVPRRSLRLNTRAHNRFDKAGIASTSQLAELTTADLIRLPHMGIGTLDVILRELAELAVSAGPLDNLDEPAPPSIPTEITASVERDWLGRMIRDLEELGEWFLTLGHPSQPLLQPPGASAPARITELWTRLQAVTAETVAGGDGGTDTIAELLNAHFLGMSDRDIAILGARMFADQEATLQELGDLHGVTRERIRQIESKRRSHLVAEMEAPGILREIAAAVRSEVFPIRPLASLLSAIPGLSGQVFSLAKPAWRVLDRMDDDYEIEDGWCATGSIEAAKAETESLLADLADDHGVVALSDFAIQQAEGSPQPSWLSEWLVYCGYEIIDGHILTRTGSIPAYAAALLAIAGEPLSMDEIHRRMPSGRALASVRNALITDSQFARVDRNLWALASWEMETYTSIRGEIRKALDENDGLMGLSALVDTITSKFSVSPDSVLAYASAPPFRVRDGVVMFGVGASAPTKSAADSRRCFQHGDSWLYRITVSHDHTRGSGFPIGAALAGIVGLVPGGQVEWSTPLGPQKFYWTGLQPAIGTIRRFLEQLDAAVGDEIFLRFNAADVEFSVELVPPLAGQAETALADALRLAGLQPELEGAAAYAALASAICVGVHAPTHLEQAYRKRGDTEIADLIQQAAELT